MTDTTLATTRRTLTSLAIPSLVQLADQASEGAKALPFHFDCSPNDMACIAMIVMRANEIGRTTKPPVAFDQLIATMDIALVHCNAAPLRLEQFLMASTADFMHDFAGIGLHIDRANCRLLHDWRPIFARQP